MSEVRLEGHVKCPRIDVSLYGTAIRGSRLTRDVVHGGLDGNPSQIRRLG